jgi:hypothetical protein
MVPRFPFDRREPCELFVPIARCFHQREVAVFGEHDQMIARRTT